ncbi:MAG: AmmeMemoRadiSam system protein B [Candidatus Aminicenantes bacterium]|nr:MAG: AmmeMemoRadiSam system protein B [Candidatus Aminicenantes bacterium]
MKRKPSVAGYFYPRDSEDLKEMIKGMLDPQADKEKAISVISPHAGYLYSGKVAGSVFSSITLPENFVILGPNHQDVSTGISIMRQGVWETPLGDISINTTLADMIMKQSGALKENAKSHSQEHSLEVQVPFIQYLKGNISFVPISIAYFATYDDLVEVGKALAGAILEFGQDTLIVASTDMSHYVSQEVAKEKDFLAIEKILDLDAHGLYETVERENISMCGFKPTTTAIIASKELKATKAELIKYQTSGDVSGDFLKVVGYAGIRII